MLRRPLTALCRVVGVVLVALLALAPLAPAHAADRAKQAPTCAPITVEDSAKKATAVFSGTVSDQTQQPRPDGQPGAVYLQTITVDMVYRGGIRTETVQVQTDRLRGACSLGALEVDREYMFFVSGTGEPWVAAGDSGTRVQNDKVLGEVGDLLGEGEPPIAPPTEHAVFEPVDTSAPQSLSRAAAPGAALVIVGLLGLLVVGGIRRRLG
ncbi:hypothetical protein G5V58_21765 [Nocardioides anomalus]|uniref:Netrin module non-TIMP type domain-containing protein n=1 Tax=Nocardioides anomalus TaxID=2712223 RepID=A0A6G6WI79_9ACTN|nr:hypothetical protein [Nocardioides anomalus]QIG45041.1 hypothetical protein G5V58_21765 [Nocardioides anomalus]